MSQQIPIASDAVVHDDHGDRTHEVAVDLAYKRLGIVNVAFYGERGSPDWVLIDAGITGSAPLIVSAAEERFGAAARPSAIILTHGHFDHIGALEALAEKWDVPIYAHTLEHPYLDGRASYPPPDPTVGGGLMAAMSGLFPRGPIDVSRWLQPLPAAGVPGMPGWEWLATPGHTPGHVSLWQPDTRTLIAGDAFITTAQESAFAVLAQRPEIHGPPMYYTPDWTSAHASVIKLAALGPQLVLTGHGPAMRGDLVVIALRRLASEFRHVAVPKEGRYVNPGVSATD
jgi:glyoxylase-like metal-dependent hydrolase (beta-lactamase superfamily II)